MGKVILIDKLSEKVVPIHHWVRVLPVREDREVGHSWINRPNYTIPFFGCVLLRPPPLRRISTSTTVDTTSLVKLYSMTKSNTNFPGIVVITSFTVFSRRHL